MPPGRDSLRGTLHLTASEPGTIPVLFTADGQGVELIERRLIPLQLEGLQLTVFGRWDPARAVGPRAFVVEREVVRGTATDPAHDGTLHREPAGDFLETADGVRLRIAKLPRELAGADGMRVWLLGSPDAPRGGGVIDPAWRPPVRPMLRLPVQPPSAAPETPDG